MTVLIMFSWDDDISEMRWKRIQSNEYAREFNVHQCFAVESAATTAESENVYFNLRTAIDAVRPDVVLIHSGLAFVRAPHAFREAVCRIHSDFPQVRLGFEKDRDSSNVLGDTKVFEVSPEMSRIEHIFFREVNRSWE